jgi:osmoprotectant transport system ATP-binding protein
MNPATPEAGLAIEFRDVEFCVPKGPTVLEKFTIEIERGETLVLLGRSGSGKTTALRLINRLLEPTAGTVLVDGRSTLEWNAVELRRHIGYVIQDAGLFPHYTVERNVAIVPHLEKWPEQRVRTRVTELLHLAGLDAAQFAKRYPHELSGGQRQRVGVARALAADPPILLMDEPFGAPDPLTRSDMQKEFLDLQKRLAKTIVFVTHDVHEALLLGNRIALLEAGKMMGLYKPDDFRWATEPLAAAYMAAYK